MTITASKETIGKKQFEKLVLSIFDGDTEKTDDFYKGVPVEVTDEQKSLLFGLYKTEEDEE